MSTPRKFTFASASSISTPNRGAKRMDMCTPRANEVVVTERVKPKQQAPRRPAVAPVNVCMYKVTDDAGDVWEAYAGANISLWQVQLDHAAQNSVMFGVRNSLNDYLVATRTEENGLPSTVQELEKQAGFRLVVVNDDADPESIGYVHWRVAFYVAGDLSNFLLFLDDWFQYKSKAMDRQTPFEVHLLPYIDVDISSVYDDLQYEHYVCNEPNDKLPLGIFEVWPAFGKRIVQVDVQIDDDSTLSLVIAGNTYAYRNRLDDSGIRGGYAGDGDSRKYFRVLKSHDVSDDAGLESLIKLFVEGVFKRLAIKVLLAVEPKQNTQVAHAVAKLREVPSLHFFGCLNTCNDPE